jgi:muramoyltetrapeptide carboxypeptidase
MFADPEVKAIICATGGISSNQILELIDYDLISKNPKIFIGYSDNTNPLLAINKKTGLVCFYGPDICELPFLRQEALESFLKFLTTGVIGLPGKIEVIKKGKEAGKLVGGYLPAINGLMTSEFSPKFSGSVLFWENVNESPSKIDFLLNQLKLSGNLKKISAMVVGHLENCVDAKYQQDNKQIEQIVLEVCKNYDFPIIKVDFFGHEIKDFYCLPIGAEVLIDTESKVFKISSEVLK